MKVTKKIQTVLMLLCVFLSALIVVAKAETSSIAEKYTYTEDKQNIIVTADHPEFSLKLKSNPTTGYAWLLREYDANLIVPVKHHFQKPSQTLMGAPGFELWTFKVKPEGFIVPQQTTIRLLYARPWQGADNATQLVFRVTTQAK